MLYGSELQQEQDRNFLPNELYSGFYLNVIML